MLSEYQKDYSEKLACQALSQKKGEIFNLERESKIINPHKMDLGTTTAETYKNFNVSAPRKKKQMIITENKPII